MGEKPETYDCPDVREVIESLGIVGLFHLFMGLPQPIQKEEGSCKGW